MNPERREHPLSLVVHMTSLLSQIYRTDLGGLEVAGVGAQGRHYCLGVMHSLLTGSIRSSIKMRHLLITGTDEEGRARLPS